MSKLYVVGTPIGNLGDFSPRAIQTLETCDFIAAEDSRVTLKLLNHFEIKKQVVSYHEHNKETSGRQILSRILAGEACALVTDAGMPAISDPGQELVALCHEEKIPVLAVPGPVAFASALAISGLPSGRFTFEGFLSMNKKNRRQHLEELKTEPRTMLFYEAPHKLANTLRDLLDAFGNRRIAIVRELTKIYEEVIRTTLEEAVDAYGDGHLKGEIVLVIEGAEKIREVYTPEQAAALAETYLAGGMHANEAAKLAAKETGVKKGDIYRLLLH